MTDVNVGGVVRETLDATDGELRAGGLVREALLSGAGTSQINLAGMAREVLVEGVNVVSAPGVGGMTASAYAHRRRFMQMVELDPRLAKKLGIRGKLVVLE